jgi:hypothetical protein
LSKRSHHDSAVLIKRAQAIMAIGLVKRTDTHFLVGATAANRLDAIYAG